MQRLPNAVIFDVDGTLYDQRPLRRRMARELLKYCVRKPFTGFRTIQVLKVFRAFREKLPFLNVSDLASTQYSLVAERLNVSPELVRRIVAEWMIQRPLVHLKTFMYHGLDSFLFFLESKMISVGVFSDYPAESKLIALGLDFKVIVDAEDPEVDRLKPDPRGLEVCAQLLSQNPGNCLFIGDRDDRDGECARRINMPYLLYDRKHFDANRFQSYPQLLNRFQNATSAG